MIPAPPDVTSTLTSLHKRNLFRGKSLDSCSLLLMRMGYTRASKWVRSHPDEFYRGLEDGWTDDDQHEIHPLHLTKDDADLVQRFFEAFDEKGNFLSIRHEQGEPIYLLQFSGEQPAEWPKKAIEDHLESGP